MTLRCFRWTRLLLLAAFFLPVEPAEAARLPLFARRYGVACAQCHVIPPKLNTYGEAFRRSGYGAIGLVPRSTLPFALWISGRRDDLPEVPGLVDEVSNYLNRIEVISGGRIVTPSLSYFLEWRPLSKETRSDGTLRDRSGRFEDVYLTAMAGPFSFTAGQFRLVDQVDVSLRLGLSEPLALASALAGSGPGTSREVGLRSFAPGARSPALRAAWTTPAAGWSLTSSVALPFPGELSIPLSDAARVEASNELELDPKGVVLESFLRRGVHSFGAHAFLGSGDRRLLNLVHTGGLGRLYWTAIAGLDSPGPDAATRGRLSLEAEFVPHRFAALGARTENRSADGAGTAFVPFLLLHAPGTRYTFRLTVEQRLQRDRNTTLIELGTVF
jgi:hypothetical protein